jgi:hypothetical protein
MLDFPSSPANAQVYNSPNGTSWIWDGAKWTSAAFTSVYTDTHYRNRIINGDMSVDQRNGGAQFTPTATVYCIDRWRAAVSQASKGRVGQAVVNNPSVFALNWTTVAAYAVAAADTFVFDHAVEWFNFNDTAWGTASAQPVVLEFWAFSSLTGTFGGALSNGSKDRSYAFTYAIAAANTWTKIRLNIPGDTTGTWNNAQSAVSLWLKFDLGTGATYRTAPGAWTAGAFNGATGTVSVVATLNATFYITGVALMVGAAAANAEPEFKKYSDNLIDCQRYYEVCSYDVWSAYTTMSSAPYKSTRYTVQKRAAPTMVFAVQASNTAVFPVALPSVYQHGVEAMVWQLPGAIAAGFGWFFASWTADADF